MPVTSPPLRTNEERLTFCDGYLRAVGARLVYQDDMYREYELPPDVDKEITNRPFFWMWAEKTGQPVEPYRLRLAFSVEAQARENARLREDAFHRPEVQALPELQRKFYRPPTCDYVTLGSVWLTRMYESIDRRGQISTVCVERPIGGSCIPWLLIHVLVSRRCDLVAQSLHAVGICLTNGQIIDDFYAKVQRLPLRDADPHELLAHATIPLEDAFSRLYAHVDHQIEAEPMEWAEQARERLRQEVRQIHTYYDSIAPELKPEEHAAAQRERERKVSEQTHRSAPHIDVQVKQVALVGLAER